MSKWWDKKLLAIAILLMAATAQGQWYLEHPPLMQTETWQSSAEILAVGGLAPTALTLGWTYIAKPQTDSEKIGGVIICHLATDAITYVCWRDDKSLTDNDFRWINPIMFSFVSLAANCMIQAFWRQ